MSIKKTGFHIAAAVAFSISGITAANAGIMHKAGTLNQEIMAVDNSVSLGFNENLMNYQEHINPGPSDTESGWMPGFKIAGSYLNAPFHVYLHLSYQYNRGGIHYLGTNLETKAAVQTTDRATTQRLMAKAGYAFSLANDMTVIPYIAGGYQHWNRNLEISVGQEIEDYNAGLIGAGGLFQYQVMPRLVLSADAEFLAVVGGSMTPHITDLGYLGHANFGTSGEEKIDVSANYTVSGPWSVYGGLDFTHFNYTGGQIPPVAFEPPSSTNQFGINAGLRYSF